jgi:hypothetical protein
MKPISLRLRLPDREPLIAHLSALAFGRSTRPAEWVAMLAANAIAVTAFAVAAADAWSVRQDLSLAQMHMASMSEAQRAAPMPQPGSTLSAAQAKSINAMARQLNVSWPDVFDVIEANVSLPVVLLSIEPRSDDAAHQRVRIDAEARQLDHLLTYADRLRRDPTIERVDLVKHETNEQDPTKPVRLSLDATLAQRLFRKETAR